MQIGVAVWNPLISRWFVAFDREIHIHARHIAKLCLYRLPIPLQLIAMFSTPDLVLDSEDESWLVATDQQIDVPPLAPNLNTSELFSI